MRKLLIVIDMQNDFIDGALGTKEAAAIVENVKAKIRSYPAADVIATMDTHTADYMETQEGKNLPVPHCIRGTAGWKPDAAVKKALGENVIWVEKGTFGAVDLPKIIGKRRKIEEFLFVGVCTDICVISNAMIVKAAFPEVPVKIAADCCAGVTPQSHENALAAMQVCQMEIV